MPAKASIKSLLFADFLKANQPDPPKSFNYWAKRKPFSLNFFGNDTVGDCTIASQANMSLRMERIETRRTPSFTDNAILTAYYNMTERLYGGGDTGAFETDALDNWRNPDHTFKDTQGRPITIDAYTKINQASQMDVKRALWSTNAKGIKACFNLPAMWQRTISPGIWDAPPKGISPVGNWLPGSWGGHSTYIYGYTDKGLWIRTWNVLQFVTWEGFALYCDEAYWVLDSADSWRKRTGNQAGQVKIGDLVDAVNSVSDIKVGVK
jgi:hypothetical protein